MATPLPKRLGVAIVMLLMILLSAGCQNIRTATSHSQARLVGTLWWMSPDDLKRPITVWQAELDQLQALGIRVMVVNGPFVGETPPAGAPDPMEAFFDEADRRRLSIYVDTLAAPDWWTLSDPAPEIARARTLVEALARR